MVIFHKCFTLISVAECDPLPEIDNGVMTLRGGNAYGNKARFKCNDGFVLGGSAERLCRSDKKWSGKVAFCTSMILDY